MRALIFCNSYILNYNIIKNVITNNDYIICCDGGLVHADALGLIPNIIIGDFDSVDIKLLEKYTNLGVKLLELPVKKDETDSEIALKYCSDRLFDEVILFGAVGQRFDHSLCNVYLLKKALKYKLYMTIITDLEIIQLIDKYIEVSGEVGDILSLIPFSDRVEGITTTGLEYTLIDKTLKFGDIIGISNVFIDNIAKISINSGLLLVIKNI